MKRNAKMIVNRSGSGTSTFRATLPTKYIRKIGLSEIERDIEIEMINDKIIISKKYN